MSIRIFRHQPQIGAFRQNINDMAGRIGPLVFVSGIAGAVICETVNLVVSGDYKEAAYTGLAAAIPTMVAVIVGKELKHDVTHDLVTPLLHGTYKNAEGLVEPVQYDRDCLPGGRLLHAYRRPE